MVYVFKLKMVWNYKVIITIEFYFFAVIKAIFIVHQHQELLGIKKESQITGSSHNHELDNRESSILKYKYLIK